MTQFRQEYIQKIKENHSNNIGSSLCLSIVMAESFDAVGCNYEEAVEPDKTHLVVPQEEEDEEDDENEDYECEEEEEYSFRFKEGEDPLEFVEYNALSGQPYKQFERLEYEALALRKRKALSNNTHSEGLAKKARVEEASRVTMEELMKSMNYGARRKSREPKKRGRQKGSRNKPNREVVQKLGEATLYYAHGCYEEAISVLHQIVLKAPHLPDAYHTLGLVHTAMGDNERALGLYMLAAHLMPKDSSLWKLLVSWSTEKGDIDQANYCLSKAITADPKDIQLRLLRASLYLELRDDQKAAESYDQIHQLCPENVEALKTGAKLYKRCGQLERAIQILEDYLNNHPTEADLSVIDLLASLLMEINEHSKALQHIENALLVYCSGNQLPFNLTAKAGICHVHLGNMQKAEMLFGVLEEKNAAPHFHLVVEVADTLMDLGHYDFALKYYLMLEGIPGGDRGLLHLKIARCNVSMKDRLQAILFFKKDSGSEIEITERNKVRSFLIQLDLGGAAWLDKVVEGAIVHGKENGFRRFYRGQRYRLIVECNRNKAGNFWKILKVENRVMRNIIVPGEYVLRGWKEFKGCLQSFFSRRSNLRAVKSRNSEKESIPVRKDEGQVVKKLSQAVVIYRYRLQTAWDFIRKCLESRLKRIIEVVPLLADRAVMWCVNNDEMKSLQQEKFVFSGRRNMAKMEKLSGDANWDYVQIEVQNSWIGEGCLWTCGIMKPLRLLVKHAED